MMLPWQDFQASYVPRPKTLHEGADSLSHRLSGLLRTRRARMRDYQQRAGAIHAASEALATTESSQLRFRLSAVRQEFQLGRETSELVDETIAILVEAGFRTIGLRAHEEQILGVLAIRDQFLIEMATGEGKSLTAALAAILFGFSRRACHVLTVNDYLADRDVNFFAPLFRFCQVSATAVTMDMSDDERRKGYQADLVYTTAKQILGDFLFDRLRMGSQRHPERRNVRRLADYREEALLLRGIHTVIVDEADSILIDEAVSPLIISRAEEDPAFVSAVEVAGRVQSHFVNGEHYASHERFRGVELNTAGYELVSTYASEFPGMWRGVSRAAELITQSIIAREFYHRDVHYVVSEQEVVIVDEYSGRMMPGRSWGNGLHQAVEAKENLPITAPTQTVVRMSFQNFFRLFSRVSGMTGTASESAGELWRIYHLPVLKIPTHLPVQRIDEEPVVCVDSNTRRQRIIEEVEKLHQHHIPVLVGTRSVAESEELADQLTKDGFNVQVLNAVRHDREAEIVSRAGQPDHITIATNMAGRGTDITLGTGVTETGGLHVIVSERHNSSRIDRQLMGRCSRQGDPGKTRTYMSLEDEIVQHTLPGYILEMLKWLLRNQPRLGTAATRLAFWYAQGARERASFKQRKQVLTMDQWLEQSITFGDPERS